MRFPSLGLLFLLTFPVVCLPQGPAESALPVPEHTHTAAATYIDVLRPRLLSLPALLDRSVKQPFIATAVPPLFQPRQASTKKTVPTAAPKWKRPTINPSMVGYIDEAAIGSELRLRFEAGFHDKTPDRAEFFYAKCGCYRGANDSSAPGPGPGIPQYVNFQQLYLMGEYAPMPRLSIFTELPIRWLQAQPMAGQNAPFPNSSGLGDWRIGIKVAPALALQHIVSFQLRATLPSGDALRGLGTNHASIEPAILYFQQVSSRFAVEAQFGDTHPLSSSKGVLPTSPHGFAGDVLFYGVGPSYLLVDRERFQLAPVLELVGWNVRGGYVTGPTETDGVNIVNLKLGPRISFGKHSSFYAGYGVALTSQNWYNQIFRMEYRHAF